MSSKKPLPSAAEAIVRTVGRTVRVARLRRRWSQALLAEKAGISHMTLKNLEHGKPGVSLGVVVSTLWALGLEGLLEPLTDPNADQAGVNIETARLGTRARRMRKLDNDF